ncbi:hypothetical protein AQUCO_00200660v1 [Aquilegia coerulea]|uniref:3'-5' exonuclease domain-containing protein n=1 Tax=Aquilegia coerulea TaxID=218851 RepID=A0A2G5F4C0_AQUCA|nr:hypothetical protein AQUCO_00200660v1 [Aquilegia coerulea]
MVATATIREQQNGSQLLDNQVYAPNGHARLWFVEFYGRRIKTTVTNKGDAVADWINRVRNNYHQTGDKNLVVGLDIENYFTQIKDGKQHYALLQLCVGTTCLVFQIYHLDYIPESLVSFLKDTYNSFYSVGIEVDVQLLKEDYELDLTNYMDLRLLASWKLNLDGNLGLKKLSKKVLQVDLEKLTWIHKIWNADKLSKKHIEYAARDAATSFYIGLNLIRIKSSKSIFEVYDM